MLPIFAAVLSLSYAVLVFEVALTRVFSVILSYHGVFVIVSGALLGLGLGSLLLKRGLKVLPDSVVSLSSGLFAALVTMTLLGIRMVPALGGGRLWVLVLLGGLPFVSAGFAISGLFQRFADRIPLLYGADLLGAALGAVTVVPLLDTFGSPNTVLFSGAIGGLATLLTEASRTRRFPAAASAVFLVFAGAFGLMAGRRIQLHLPISDDPDKEMHQILANPALKARVIESRWSSFGQTDVVQSELVPDHLLLFVDGAAGSVMYKRDAILRNSLERASVTSHHGGFFPLPLLDENQKRNALVIGAGGGKDVIAALLGGVQHVTAVEVNPDVVKIVRDYKDFNGGIYSGDPGVTVIVEEGRSFVRRVDTRFDLIILAIPVIKSSRSVDGYMLTESYLYTVEAISDYLDHLAADGRIVIVAHNDVQIYRLLSMTVAAFGRQAVGEREVMKRIYTVAADIMPAIVIQKRPLTTDEAAVVMEAMHKRGFDKRTFYVPYQEQGIGATAGTEQVSHLDERLVQVAQGTATLAGLAGSASYDISPVSDDRPFFYDIERGIPSPLGEFALVTLLAVLVLAGLVVLRGRSNRDPTTFAGAIRGTPALRSFLLLFALLGMGYMLVEISLFQKLMLFVGQPQRALTVLLFSLLLGGGMGSLASVAMRKAMAGKAAAISLIISLAVLLLSAFFAELFELGLSPTTTSAAQLLPLGFLMGFPFPIAIKLLDGRGFGRHVSVMWGANAIASVLGSVLSMIVALRMGFSWALILGAVCYALVALLFRRGDS